MPRNLKNYIHEKSAEPHTVSVAVVCTLLMWLSNNKISTRLVLWSSIKTVFPIVFYEK